MTGGDQASYVRLGGLNPRLLARPRSEIEALLDEIQKCGYIWYESKKCFRNPEIGVDIRTQGLDLFTPEEFRRNHEDIYSLYQSDPKEHWRRSRVMYRWRKWSLRLVLVGVADVLLGWAVCPVEIWLPTLAVVVALFVLLATQARAVGERISEEMMEGVERDLHGE